MAIICPCLFCFGDMKKGLPMVTARWADTRAFWSTRLDDPGVVPEAKACVFGPRHAASMTNPLLVKEPVKKFKRSSPWDKIERMRRKRS